MPTEQNTFSPQALKAKEDTKQAIRDQIAQEIVDNWALNHGKEPPINALAVQAELDQLTKSSVDANGKKKKYTQLGDKLVPTKDTIEEFGNASARAVDNGTQIMGMSWLNSIFTAIKALIMWATGNADSFTDAYAKITTQDISTEANKELDALSKDPEHKQFIEKNKLREKGKEKIASSVRHEAGLGGAAALPAFDLNDYIKKHPPKFVTTELAKGSDATEIISNTIKDTVDNTLEPYKIIISALPEDDQKTLTTLSRNLKDNATKLAEKIKQKIPEAPKSAKEFADQAIIDTVKNMEPKEREKFGLDENPQSVDDVIQKLNSSGEKNKAVATLLSKLRANLQETHGKMTGVLGIVQTDAEKARAAADAKQAQAAAQKQGKDTALAGMSAQLEQTLGSINFFNEIDGAIKAKVKKDYPTNPDDHEGSWAYRHWAATLNSGAVSDFAARQIGETPSNDSRSALADFTKSTLDVVIKEKVNEKVTSGKKFTKKDLVDAIKAEYEKRFDAKIADGTLNKKDWEKYKSLISGTIESKLNEKLSEEDVNTLNSAAGLTASLDKIKGLTGDYLSANINISHDQHFHGTNGVPPEGKSNAGGGQLDNQQSQIG